MNDSGNRKSKSFIFTNVTCCIVLGLNLVESYPYETVQRDHDYVRLASITAGKTTYVLLFLFSIIEM